jgi:hypothetical protein
MKKRMKSFVGLAFFLLLGASAFAQDPSIEEIKPLTFKTQADLDAWISSNPREYQRLKSLAEEVSETYIGKLIVVEELIPEELKVVQPLNKDTQFAEPIKKAEPINQGKAPAAFPTTPDLEGFPVKENTGDAEADQKRYEEAKKAWYEQNKMN